MIRRILYPILLIPMLMTSGCNQTYDFIPDRAGDNKTTLIRVLDSCRQDSDSNKYRAAEFLIRHMGWHISQENDGIYPDASILTYDFLIDQINHAIWQWQNSPYAQGLSFEEFCEYLLPYRAVEGYGNNISAEERYDWVTKNIAIPDSLTGLKELIWYYNNAVLNIRATGGRGHQLYHDGLNDLHYEDFVDCRDKAVQTCLNLRAIGVPCVVEHTIGYRTLRSHHYYCAVWDTKHQEWLRFHGEGIKYYPGDDDWTSAELLNIYRETYAPQPDNSYCVNDIRPYRFESPCQLDVTHHTVGIELQVDSNLNGYVPYLSTFHRTANGSGLQPFTYGRVDGNKLVFDHVVPTVWYVVTIYPDGKEQVVSRPFWVNETEDGCGYITYADFESSTNDVENVVLFRKYPVKEFLVERARSLIGTKVVGSNKPDFSESRTLWTLDSMPLPKVKKYPFRATGNYRYYRLITNGACEVSELEWLEDSGKPISPTDSSNKAYDGDMTTAPVDSNMITLSLPEMKRIVAINIAPINADNAITHGHIYQLYVWKDYQGWVLHSTHKAMSDSIKFSGVPKHAMLWLKDTTKGQEEMPMFYEQGKQRFIYCIKNSQK